MAADSDSHGFYDDSPGLEPRGVASGDALAPPRRPLADPASNSVFDLPASRQDTRESRQYIQAPSETRVGTDDDVEAAAEVTSDPTDNASSLREAREPYGRALQRALTGESLSISSRSRKFKVHGRLLGRRRIRPTSATSGSLMKPSRATTDARDEAERLARVPDSEKAKQPPKAEKRHGVKERVLHFTPSWFSVTMGTGVITTLLNLLPWPSIHSGLRYPALVFLFADTVIFIVFICAFVARYIMYPEVLPLTFKHPQKSMFLGTLPMGFITIISGIAQMGTVEFELGKGFALAASGLWWLATAISLTTAIGVPFSMMTYQKHNFEGTTAALLLPIVPPITAAATGSVLAEILMQRYATYAFTIMVVSYLVLGIGLPIALLILVLYFQRLLLFKSPPRDVIISVFLPLGPCGQGGEACLHLGQVALRLFPRIATRPDSGVTQLVNVGEALYGAGLISALLLFGLGVWWLAIGLLTILRETQRGRLPFNMGWWGLTFPFASLAICCARLALVLDSLALKVAYTGFVIANVLLWAYVAIPTAKGAWTGRLFNAPCLADLPLKP
ncbi:Plasma membrane sulfite pump involved in sulfite metabolism [Thecaphora frezii]